MAEDPAPAARGAAVADVSPPAKEAARGEGDPAVIVATLRRRAWDSLGLERDGAGLRGLLDDLGALAAQVSAHPRQRSAAEARNLVAVAQSMAIGALFREESRGGHFRTDFPDPDDARFLGHTLLTTEGPRLIPVDAVAAAA
jgi:succinate dehydrogenase/fumarate reductase flavoprotein subunit